MISGDVLTDIDLTDAREGAPRRRRDRRRSRSKHVENPLEFGIVITQPDGTIERFLEKPTWGQVFSDTINTGIYVLEPEVFDFIPEGEVVDFSGDVFPALLDGGHTLHGHVADGYWEDVGTLEAYIRAHTDVLDGQVKVDIDGFRLGDGRWIGSDVEISPRGARRRAGRDRRQLPHRGGRARLRPYTVLGTDVIVKADAFLERAVCHDHVYVGPGANLRGCVIGRNTDLRAHVRVEDGTVVGDECFIGQDAVINPNVKVYPFKTVESGAIVTSSIVWESRGARTLFGRRGVRGLANVDINPEVAVRVAMAYGTALPKGVDRHHEPRHQPHRPRAEARADRRAQPRPASTSRTSSWRRCRSRASRCATAARRAASPCASRPATPTPSRSASSTSTGATSTRAMQRKVERLLYREDYRRAFGGEIGDIVFPPRSLEFYTAALERVGRHRRRCATRQFKIVLDYSFGAVSIVMPSLLTKLGAEVLAVNPFASTASATRPPRSATRQRRPHRRARAGVGERPRLRDRPRRRARRRSSTTRGHVLEPEELLLAIVALVAEAVPDARVAVPVNVTSAVERSLGVAGRGGAHDGLGRRASWRPRRARRSTFAGTRRRRLHLARLPARVRRRGHAGEAARPARGRRPSAVDGGRGAPRRSTWRTRRSSRRGSARAR